MPPKRKRVAKVGSDGGDNGKAAKDDGESPKKKRSESGSAGSPKIKVELTEEEKIATAIAEKVKKVAKKQISKVKRSKASLTSTKIQCAECPKIFRYEDNFKKHLEMEHSKLPSSVQCKECTVRCPNAKTLKAHVDNVHKRDVYECPDCKKQFVRNAHVLRHMAQKGCDGAAVTIYPCEICDAQFSRKDNLMVHLRLQHITRKAFSCKECTYSTGNFSKLIIHKQKFHSDSKIQHFECDHCRKVVNSRAAMCKHLEIHGDKKYACDVCGYNTFTIEVMRRHVLTHVQEKPYQCPQCDNSFIQRSQLQNHMQRHDGQNTCNSCKRQFITTQKLMKHIQTTHIHPNQKDKQIREIAKKHLAALAPVPLSCDVCGRTYGSEKLMRKHMQSHTLERPRRCMYCVVARAYVRGIQLVRHVRKAHPQMFKEHLHHVREVLGSEALSERVKKSEMDAILNVLDAEAERIIEGYGEGVLYGGMQETEVPVDVEVPASVNKNERSTLMTEEELASDLNKLLVQLIDKELLECFGWPDESVDTVLEKVIENCGAKPADPEKWTRVQRLRENAKHLFLYVIEDKNIARMLDSHTIDQIVKHILSQVSGDDEQNNDIEVERKSHIEDLLYDGEFVDNTVVENVLPVE